MDLKWQQGPFEADPGFEERLEGASKSLMTNKSLVGKVKHFLPSWKQLTNNQWVLDAIKGYNICFNKKQTEQLVVHSTITFSD